MLGDLKQFLLPPPPMFKCVVHLCLHMCGHVSHMHVHVEAEVDARSHPGLCSHFIYWGRVSQPWAHRTWLVSLVSLLWGAPVSDFLWLGLWAGHQASLALRLWGPEPDPCTFLANTQTTSTSSQPHLRDSQLWRQHCVSVWTCLVMFKCVVNF